MTQDIAPAALDKLALGHEQIGVGLPPRAEDLGVAGPQRAFVGGAQQVGEVDRLVLVPHDRRLDRPLEELVGVAAEELVERVLASDVDGQPAPAPARAAPHLPQRRDRAWEGHADRGVEGADVDAELERIRGHHRQKIAARELCLELAPLLRRVAGAVWRDALAELGPELLAHQPRDELHRLARLDEADRSRALADELGEQVGRLAQRAAAQLERLVDDRRVPHRDLAPGARRSVLVDEPDVVEPGQPLGELDRVGDRRAREQEPGRRAVGARDAAQPAQDVADMGAEHAAVDVRLVDDDDREVGEEVRPRRVVGQDPDVEHVGVGEHEVRPPADRLALLALGVAVVDGGPTCLCSAKAFSARAWSCASALVG
jgi:hypothetical protein